MNSITGVPTIPDGGRLYQPRQGRQGDTISSNLHGYYSEQMVRGNLWMATVGVAGIALITTATTGNCPTIWNPLGSGVVLSFVSLSYNMLSGTCAPAAIGWYITTATGSTVATAAPIATFTAVAPISCCAGLGGTPKALWAPATCTFTAAPVFYCGADLSTSTYVVTAVTPPMSNVIYYDGALGLYPGTALSLCSTTATTTAKFVPRLVWEEIPL
jgi:hypothetical protein